jgi:hypothetical protein
MAYVLPKWSELTEIMSERKAAEWIARQELRVEHILGRDRVKWDPPCTCPCCPRRKSGLGTK